MATPLTAAKRRKIIALREAGKGRNDIAREAGVAAATVSKVIAEAGLSFDRTATKAATAAKQADSRARRAALAGRLLDEAQTALEEMHKPHLVFAFGGKDNTFESRTVDAPPTSDKRNLMMIASTALQRHMDLERHDADEKAENAKSMLLELGKALGVQTPDAA